MGILSRFHDKKKCAFKFLSFPLTAGKLPQYEDTNLPKQTNLMRMRKGSQKIIVYRSSKISDARQLPESCSALSGRRGGKLSG